MRSLSTLFLLTKLDKWLVGFLIFTLVQIETTASLEGFRKFIIISTCRSFIPESYLRDYEVFPEREEGPGAIYIEAADKVTLKKIREMTFVNAKEILGIIYSSKSGQHSAKVEADPQANRQGPRLCIAKCPSQPSGVRCAYTRMGGQLFEISP